MNASAASLPESVLPAAALVPGSGLDGRSFEDVFIERGKTFGDADGTLD